MPKETRNLKSETEGPRNGLWPIRASISEGRILSDFGFPGKAQPTPTEGRSSHA